MSRPLVTIITPTVPDRQEVFLTRCLHSVLAQTYRPIQWIVITDENSDLVNRLHGMERGGIFLDYVFVKVIELGRWWRTPEIKASPGAWPYFLGTQCATGDYIGYLADDDEYRSHHVSACLEVIQKAKADFVVSKVEYRCEPDYSVIVGNGILDLGFLDTDAIFHRAEILSVANWRPSGPCSDWDLVRSWRDAGLKGAFCDSVTAIHHGKRLAGWVEQKIRAAAAATP